MCVAGLLFNDTATTEIYTYRHTLALHDALPISPDSAGAANASLASIRSRSAISQPAFSSARRLAGTGPIPMIDGSTPALAQLLIVASTGAPNRKSTRLNSSH